MVQIPWHQHFGSYHPWQESIPAVSCCTVLLSAPEGTRTMSAKTKKKPNKLYFAALCVCWGAHIGLEWKQMYPDMTNTICSPPSLPKNAHLFLFRVEMATHSIKHPHTDTNSQKIKTQWSVRDRRTEELEKQSNVERRYQVTGYALRIVFSFLKIIKLVNSHIRVHAFTHCGQV